MNDGAQACQRATSWQVRNRTLSFGEMPAIMGIVNVTPDSFSDGGRFLSVSSAVDHALRLEDDGADILDIGGESTRPYAEPVDEEQELRRVSPVLERLSGRVSIPISIDTSKASVARAAIERGAEIINDVTGLSGDPHMSHLASETQVGVCAMHMQGTPQTMQDAPRYDDVVYEVFSYLQQRKQALLTAGIALPRICLDPGIGFGKTHAHNLDLVQGCRKFLQLECPILVGHSRKGFIGKLIGDKQRERSAGSVGMSLALARQGVQLIRVHDVGATRDALLCFAAAGGLTN